MESPFKRASNFPRSRAATPGVGGGADTPVPPAASSRSPSRSRTPVGVPSYSEVRESINPSLD